MTKISIQPDCGNSPRKLFLRDLNVALARGDLDFLKDNTQKSIKWEIAGDATTTGKDDYLKAITEYQLWKAKELIVDTIITHGGCIGKRTDRGGEQVEVLLL